MNKPTVLVTGSTGYVGRHLVTRLLASGVNVVGLTRGRRSQLTNTNGQYCEAIGDINDESSLNNIIKRYCPDYVVHLAGENHIGDSWENPVDFVERNVIGTMRLLDQLHLCLGKSLRRVLLIGSAHEYQFSHDGVGLTEEMPLIPSNPYGWSKVFQTGIAKMYARLYDTPIVVARTFPLIGPGHSRGIGAELARQVVEIEQGLKDPVLSVGNLHVRRDFLDVRDAVAAYQALLFCNKMENGEVFNVCSGNQTEVSELIEILHLLALRPFNVHCNSLLSRPGEPKIVYGSNKKLRKAVNWKPEISLFYSVADTLMKLREQNVSTSLTCKGVVRCEGPDAPRNAP